ncbi:leucine-rich repeat domain-containing protein [Fluviispira vulneris]|uniref:leucine-rich repeat domain-containing protein n=1 Tax=Fluviispira vulneris TaxID=2763012 RepID=UPI001644EBF8|nr:leucine-rich repeat domain-containing protein [Fluviispira vulneris]
MRYHSFASLTKIAFCSLFLASCAKKTINDSSTPKSPTLANISTCSKNSKGMCKKPATKEPSVNEIVPAPEVNEIVSEDESEYLQDDSKNKDETSPSQDIKNIKSPIESDIPTEEELTKTQDKEDTFDDDMEEFFKSYLYFQINKENTFHIAYLTLDTDGKTKIALAEDNDGNLNYGGLFPEELLRFRIPVMSDVGPMGLYKFTVRPKEGNKNSFCEKVAFTVAKENVYPEIILKESMPIEVFKDFKKAQFCTYEVYDNDKKLASFNLLFNKTFLDWCFPAKTPMSNAEKSALAIVDHFKQTRDFSLSRSELEKIKSIKTLKLSSNVISDLAPLTGFIKLEELDLRRSSLKRIPQGIFYNLRELKTLDLSENQITKIYPSNFIGLNNLSQLYLGNNLFEKIEEKSFDILTSLKRISLLSSKKFDLSDNLFSKHKKLNKESLSEINFIKGKKINFSLKLCEFGDSMCEENNENEENLEYITEEIESEMSPLNRSYSEFMTSNTWEITNKVRQFVNNEGVKVILPSTNYSDIIDYMAIRNDKIYFCSIAKSTSKIVFNGSLRLLNFSPYNKSFSFKNPGSNIELTTNYKKVADDYVFSYSNLDVVNDNDKLKNILVETITYTRKVTIEEFISLKDKCRIPFEVEDVLEEKK